MTAAARLDIPSFDRSPPALLFTPGNVAAMRVKRDTYAWARHGYYEALLSAERINRPTPSGGDDGWVVPPMAWADNGRGREHFVSAFNATLVGYLDGNDAYLERAYETLTSGLEETAERWWQPVSLRIAMAADGLLPSLSGSQRERLEQGLRHALEVRPHRQLGGNIGAGDRKAMAGFGVVLGDRELVDEAINDPERGTLALLAGGMREDGLWFETAPCYHHYALLQFLETAWLCERIGVDLKGALDGLLLTACRAAAGLMDAQGGLPATGDTHRDRDQLFASQDRPVYELAAALFGDSLCGWLLRKTSRCGSASLVFGVPEPPAEEPASTSRLYRDSGVAALRTGPREGFWGSDGLTAYLRYGPHGGWHGHEDSLQLELRAFGLEMVTDRRRAHRYRNPSHYGWHRTTLAHSTVVIDGRSQERGYAGGECRAFATGPVSAVVAVNPHAYPGIDYERRVVLTDRYALDDFRVQGEGEHLFHYVLHGEGTYELTPSPCVVHDLPEGDGYDHLARPRATPAAGPWEAVLRQGSWDSDRWSPTGTGMRVRPLGGTFARLIVAGAWDGDSLGTEDCLIVERRGGSAQFRMLLEPFRGDGRVRAARQAQDGRAVCVRVDMDDVEDLVCFDTAPGSAFSVDDVEFDGEFLFLRRSGGRVVCLQHSGTRVLMVGGTDLSGGRESGIEWAS